MALALNRENYTLHKLHSLTGIFPVGYYLVQHLTLNTFALAGADKFNGIIHFFNSMPFHILIALKAVAIWIPLLFHAVYGVFIASRAKFNANEPKYRFRENRYYTLQRATGIVIFLFLCYHMSTTSIAGKIYGEGVVQYEAWASKLAAPNGTYLVLLTYVVGIVASCYHFSFGLWSFCIRWGITVNQKSQDAMWRVAQVSFPALSVLGLLALAGFFWTPFAPKGEAERTEIRTEVRSNRI